MMSSYPHSSVRTISNVTAAAAAATVACTVVLRNNVKFSNNNNNSELNNFNLDLEKDSVSFELGMKTESGPVQSYISSKE